VGGHDRYGVGDGRAAVVIPRYVPTPRFRPRTWAFLGVAALLGLVFVGWQRPSIPLVYDGAVRDVAVAITRDPATVNGYVARLHPATLYLAVAYIVGISLVVRASLARRLAMLGHAVLYVALSLLAQALMITVGVTTRWLVAPFGIEAVIMRADLLQQRFHVQLAATAARRLDLLVEHAIVALGGFRYRAAKRGRNIACHS